MRLINTSTIKLHEFFGDAIPLYAILSHRWEGREITFQELSGGAEPIPGQPGWDKILGCCAQAMRDGFEFAWIDSCCIDKTSSAELSEAINSMFRWYEDAQVCYAYLSDVPSAAEDPREMESKFRNSKWFTRGWTLQELLAPQSVEFYDQDWVEIGTKRDLAQTIMQVTRISSLSEYRNSCIAQKMSWIASRSTTRAEDMAYCMMGLFDVHMPLLYGEGTKAFIRLQLEILTKTDDESILCWSKGHNHSRGSAILATSPLQFIDCHDVGVIKHIPTRQPWAMTNKGMRLELLPLKHGFHYGSTRIVVTPLNCSALIKDKQDGEVGLRRGLALKIFTREEDSSNVVHNHLTFFDSDEILLSQPKIFFFNQQEDDPYGIVWLPTSSVKVQQSHGDGKAYSISDQFLQLSDSMYADMYNKAFWDISSTGSPVIRNVSPRLDVAALKFSNDSAEALFLVIGYKEDGPWFRCSLAPNLQPLNVQANEEYKAHSRVLLATEEYQNPERVSLKRADGTNILVAMKRGADKGLPINMIVISVEAKMTWFDG